MLDSNIITLTTDFGETFYTGIMKGVILSINPSIKIITISNNIRKFSVDEARFILSNSYSYFPERSVHLSVIDPGVGSERKPIVVKTEKYFFVGPDNGVFSFLKKEDIENIFEIEKFASDISSTFHGRDIFAPVAAKIASGLSISGLIKKISLSESYTFSDSFEDFSNNRVVFIDDFGNIILGLKSEDFFKAIENKKWELHFKNLKFTTVKKNYFSVKKGEFLLLVNSLGYLEIACREDNAAKKLNAISGDEFFIGIY